METARKDTPRREAADDLHARDFFTWTQRQAELMRAGLFERVDIENLIEEIETLGRSEASALESAYRLICLHQLKRMVQPERTVRSWTNTIIRERLHAARVLRDNPGLKPRRQELFETAYADARKEAAGETGIALHVFPELAPFTLAQMSDESFWVLPSDGGLEAGDGNGPQASAAT